MLRNDTRSAIKHSGGAIDAPILPQLIKTAGALGEGCVLLKAVMTKEFVQYRWSE